MRTLNRFYLKSKTKVSWKAQESFAIIKKKVSLGLNKKSTRFFGEQKQKIVEALRAQKPEQKIEVQKEKRFFGKKKVNLKTKTEDFDPSQILSQNALVNNGFHVEGAEQDIASSGEEEDSSFFSDLETFSSPKLPSVPKLATRRPPPPPPERKRKHSVNGIFTARKRSRNVFSTQARGQQESFYSLLFAHQERMQQSFR